MTGSSTDKTAKFSEENAERVQPIHDADWDHLIIVDACRYDFFKQVYNDYLDGDLSIVKSRASATDEWLKNTFSASRYNINYISANVFVNKSGMRLDDWYADDKFTSVKEAWRHVWDEDLHTAHPEETKDFMLDNILNHKKNIFHFVQPHRPLISCPKDQYTFGTVQELRSQEPSFSNSLHRSLWEISGIWKPLFDRLNKKNKDHIRSLLGISHTWELREYDDFIEEVGKKNVENYYEKDLRLALENVSRLVSDLDGKVIVTADHGEAFGENGDYGHPKFSDNPVLRNVPWLEVKQR